MRGRYGGGKREGKEEVKGKVRETMGRSSVVLASRKGGRVVHYPMICTCTCALLNRPAVWRRSANANLLCTFSLRCIPVSGSV